MDWFRNVPNVIRSSNSMERNENSRSFEDNTTDMPRVQTVKEEFNLKYHQRSQPVPMKKNVEDITCALCAEIYNDPRLLPCLHSFCRRCLEHTVNPRSTSLTCHLCRKEITLKINGIAEFPPNFIINNLIDVDAVKNSVSKPMLCNSCNEQLPATARCLDCMDFLCYACHNAHSRVRMTKDHQILTLEQLKRSEDIAKLLHRPVFCQMHKDEKVTYYCNTCQLTICRECVITTHQQNQHDYTLIEQTVNQQRDEICSLKEVIEQKLMMLDRATTNLSKTQQQLDARSALIQSEIKERTPRLMKLIEEKERLLLDDLHKVVSDRKTILHKQLENLDSEYKKLQAMYKFAEKALCICTDAELLSLKYALCEKLKVAVKIQHAIEPEVDDHISCNTNDEGITSSIQNYGKLSTSGEMFLKCSVLGNVNTAIKGQVSQLTLLMKNQYGFETACSKQDIEAQIKTPEYGILVPEIREKSESTFTLSFRTYSIGIHQLSIKLKGKPIFGSPFSITVVEEQNPDVLIPLLKENRQEDVYTGNRSNMQQMSRSPIEPRSPSSYSQPLTLEIADHQSHDKMTPENNVSPLVALGRDTNYLAGNQHQEKISAIFLFSIGRRGTQVGEFHGVFGVASDRINKRIIATDCHNNRIQVFTEGGEFLFCFGQRGSNDGEFQSPTGVGVGADGEIVVCERLKGRIQVFNSSGEFQRRFILNQLKASTLAVDGTGRIIIADYTNCCIYILDPILERWSKFGHFGQSEGELQYPCYVATDSKGNIYVSDMNSNKIQMYDSDSMYIRSFGSKGDGDGEFLHPTGITIDTKGRLIVADRDNHRIQVLNAAGDMYAKFGSKGDHDGEVNDTHGIAVLSNGNIAAADLKNNRIQVFTIISN